MNFENMNIWCWIIPALVGLICGILGYLIGKGSTKTIDNSRELKSLNEKNSQLKADLEACNKRVSGGNDTGASKSKASYGNLGTKAASLGATAVSAVKSTGDSVTSKASSLGATAASAVKSTGSTVTSTASSLGSSAASAVKSTGNAIGSQASNLGATAASLAAGAAATGKSAFDASGAKAIFGKTIKQDDLKLVEGIGPKIEGMFKEHGIKTWQELANASVAECQKVLDTGGKRYQIHDPSSWPLQAGMCSQGKWQELKKWQSEHKHGKL